MCALLHKSRFYVPDINRLTVLLVVIAFCMFQSYTLSRLYDFVDGSLKSFKVDTLGLYAQFVSHLKHRVGRRYDRYAVAFDRADKQVARPQHVAYGFVHGNRAVLDSGDISVFFKVNMLFFKDVVQKLIV